MTTPTVNRRTFLGTAAATAGFAAIPGSALAAEEPEPLDVRIFQTRELVNDAVTADAEESANPGDAYHPARVAAAHTRNAFEPLVELSDQYSRLDVTIDQRPIDLELRGTEAIVRLLEWNGMLSEMDHTATHSNLLIDTQYNAFPVIGVALLNRSAPQGALENNACILDFGQELLGLEADPNAIPDESPVVVKDDLVGNPEFIASAAPHEIGHTVMAEHGGGMAWRDEELKRVSTSIMMGAYILDQGGKDNLCGRELPEVETREKAFVDDIYVRNEFAPCVVKNFLDDAYDHTPGVGSRSPEPSVATPESVSADFASAYDTGSSTGTAAREYPEWAQVFDIGHLTPFVDRFLARYQD